MTQTEIDDLKQRVNALEDIVYERGLNVREFDKIALAIQLKFDLPRSKAMMLRHLMTDAFLSRESIIEIVDQHGGRNLRHSGPRSASHIGLLRKQMGPFGIVIHSARSTGFYLTEDTKARVRTMCAIDLAKT